MDEHDWLAERFEANRSHLRAVAYRMLGSETEADDAVQEAWLRLSRSDADSIENLGGWLTTVVGRVSLDMLRSRASKREDPLDSPQPGSIERHDGVDPADEALLADSVGPALLVVLETLGPAERLAFVLHDLFAMPFDEIAPIVGRSSAATRQLASRARRRVQGGATVPDADLSRQRQIVDAFLAASRGGHFDALLALLDPDVVLRADRVAVPVGATEVYGAEAVAGRARLYRAGARFARPAIVDGSMAIVTVRDDRPAVVLRFTIMRDKIVQLEVIGDPERLDELEIVLLDA